MQQKILQEGKTLFKRMTVSEISFLSYSKAPKCTCPNSLARITCAVTQGSRNDTCQSPLHLEGSFGWHQSVILGQIFWPLRAQAFWAPCTLCICQHLQVLLVITTMYHFCNHFLIDSTQDVFKPILIFPLQISVLF